MNGVDMRLHLGAMLTSWYFLFDIELLFENYEFIGNEAVM